MTSPSAAGLQGVLEDGHLRKMDPTPDGSVAVPIPIIKTAILRLHRQKKNVSNPYL